MSVWPANDPTQSSLQNPQGFGTSLATTGALGGLGGLAMFVGPLSGIGQPELAKAQQMATSGASPEDIWRATGQTGQPWYQDPSQRWWTEISDEGARYQRGAPQFSNLSEVLSHPNLYEAYPGAANVSASPSPRSLGAGFSPGYPGVPEAEMFYGTRQGSAATPQEYMDQVRSRLLHEAQHYVQWKEGALPAQPTGALSGEEYLNNPSEVQARETQARRNLTMGQRIAMPPSGVLGPLAVTRPGGFSEPYLQRQREGLEPPND